MGWTLDPGYIGPAGGDELSAYHSPDGGEARTPTLEETSRRMRTYQSGNSNCASFPCTIIEFPDGSMQVFDHSFMRQKATGTASPDFTDQANWPDDNTPRYGLTKIIDRFGNIVLRVTWDTTNAWKFTSFVLYTDQSVTISLTWGSSTVGGTTWQTIQSITFPMTGNQTQTVAFTYDTSHGLGRNVFDTSMLWNGSPCHNPTVTSVPYLTQIAFKDGSGTTLASYQSAPCLGPFGLGYSCFRADYGGAVAKLTLPTGGAISYLYFGTTSICSGLLTTCPDPELADPGGTPIGGGGCPPPSDPVLKFGDHAAGVYERDELDAGGSTVSTITYGRYDYIPHNDSDCRAPYLTDSIARQVVVTKNSGDGGFFKVNHLFHRNYNTGDGYDSDDGGREIERRYFDKNVGINGTPVRTVINCLTTTVNGTDGSVICGYRSVRDSDIHHINAYHLVGQVHEQRSVTWYGDNPTGIPTPDDGGTCNSSYNTACSESANTSTSWDDTAKNYGTTTQTNTLLPMFGWTKRAHTTVWNAQVTQSKWLLDIFSSKSVADNDGSSSLPAPSKVTTNYGFDTNTGFLNKFWVTDSTYGTLTHDFSTTPPDQFGNPTSRKISGDWTSVYFTDTWSFAKNGFLSSKRTAPAGISWKSFDVDRDGGTNPDHGPGLITTSRDANSLAITYTYDALGRLTAINPPGSDLATTISYDSTTQTTVSRGSGTSGTWQRYLYDSLGRLSCEIRQMPPGGCGLFVSRLLCGAPAHLRHGGPRQLRLGVGWHEPRLVSHESARHDQLQLRPLRPPADDHEGRRIRRDD